MGVEQTAKIVLLPPDRQDAAGVQAALQPYAGRRAALVMTFGATRSPGDGVALASRVNTLARQAVPQVLDGALVRDFWQAGGGELATGSARLEIYLFTQ